MPKLLYYLNPKLSASVIAAVFLSIPAANANEAWLVLTHGVIGGTHGFGGGKVAVSDSSSLTTVPMKTMEGCMTEGEKWKVIPSTFRKGFRSFQCISNK